MPVIQDLKTALGDLARLSAGYTPEVIQQKRALAKLGEVNLRGKLLENEAKLQQMAQSRETAARLAKQAEAQQFQSAVGLQSQLPSMEDPSFVGPRFEDNNMLNVEGEGLLPGYDTASEIYDIAPEKRPIVRSVAGGIRDRADLKDRRETERFEMEMGAKERQEQLTNARIQKELAMTAKLARDDSGGSGSGGSGVGGSELEDAVSNLLSGMPARIPIKLYNQAVAEARRRGGYEGTGFVAGSQKQQDNFDLYRDIYSKVGRLQQLLQDREVTSRLGPYLGRLTDWTMELPNGAPTQVKEAWNLFRDLSDTELRKRSGAAISPGEYLRIVGFTVDPTKQLDSNSTNLARMRERIENSLRLQGVRNFDALRNGGGAPASTPDPSVVEFDYDPQTGRRVRR